MAAEGLVVGPGGWWRVESRLRGKHMTQAQLAAAADVSLDLVRKLEQGARHTASLKYLHRLANALDVEIGELLRKPTRLPEPGPGAGVVALRRAVTGVDDLLVERDQEADESTLADLRRHVTFAWGAYWAGRYDQLGEVLPRSLTAARTVERSGVAADCLAQLYQVAACTLVHFGQPDAAHIAVREALRIAGSGTDPWRPAALWGTLSWVLLTQGRFAEAHRLAVSAAESIEPGDRVELPRMSLWGSLLLSGATAAGRNGEGATAAQLLGEAADIARHTGNRNDYEVAFGPDQVTMQTVDVHVVTESYTSALTRARDMPSDTSLPLAAQARHLQDRALAHARLGHAERAVNMPGASRPSTPRLEMGCAPRPGFPVRVGRSVVSSKLSWPQGATRFGPTSPTGSRAGQTSPEQGFPPLLAALEGTRGGAERSCSAGA